MSSQTGSRVGASPASQHAPSVATSTSDSARGRPQKSHIHSKRTHGKGDHARTRSTSAPSEPSRLSEMSSIASSPLIGSSPSASPIITTKTSKRTRTRSKSLGQQKTRFDADGDGLTDDEHEDTNGKDQKGHAGVETKLTTHNNTDASRSGRSFTIASNGHHENMLPNHGFTKQPLTSSMLFGASNQQQNGPSQPSHATHYTQPYQDSAVSPIVVPHGLTKLLDSMEHSSSQSQHLSTSKQEKTGRTNTHSRVPNSHAQGHRIASDIDSDDDIETDLPIPSKISREGYARSTGDVRISYKMVEALKKHILTMAQSARTQSHRIRHLESMLQATQAREQALIVRHQRDQQDAYNRITYLESKIDRLKKRAVSGANDAVHAAKDKSRALELELYKERLNSKRLREEVDVWRQREASALHRHESVMARHVAGIRSVEATQASQTVEAGKLRRLYELAAQRIETTQEHLEQLTLRLKSVQI